MNIYRRELKANTRSFLVWSATMVFLIFAGMMKYDAFAKTGESVNQLFAALPAGLMKVMGIAPGMDLNSIGVFYSVFYPYFLLLTSAHGCLLGANIIAKEERDRTADFLLVKPIRRYQAVTAKVLAAGTFMVLFNLVTSLTSIAVVAPMNTSGSSLTGPILWVSLALLITQVLFLSAGLFLGAWAKNASRASGIATAVILGTFIFKMVIDLSDGIEWLSFLTPFLYFDSLKVMYEHEFRLPYLLLSGGMVVLLISGTYFFFQKRDILN
ncbi:MAG: ABC transporter permease subunit [Eubacteriales bacterium]|nr:ABC transporter permease subunit [Eubacteriales bacterium]